MFKKNIEKVQDTFEGFKEFAIKGNVIDLAVGVIIGAAFGKIITSLVNDMIMPPIGYLSGGVDFSNLKIVLKQATNSAEAVSINYGMFLNTVIDFLIVAFVIYIMITQLQKFKKKEEKKESEKPPAKPSEEVVLLREIRDALKK